jgi:integrase
MSEGTVFERSDGRWCAKWKDANGKWRYLYRKTKGEAKQALRDALQDRDDNIVPADKLTLNDAMDQWLEGMQDTVSRRTYVNRESLVRIHIKPHAVGSKSLCKLTPEHLRSFYREKLQSLSPGTVGRLHDAISKGCREQVKAKRLRSNPAADVKPPKNPQREMDVLTPQQVKHLLETIRGTRYEIVTVLGAACALRVGEALSLRYEDCDLIAGTICIRRTLWKGKVYPPKTPTSRRTLKLPAIALEALKRHSESHGNPTGGYLLATSNGNPVAAENFWRWGWKPALRKAGLPESLTYHQLRHGAISLLIQQQVPIPIISKYAGHSTPAITFAVYGHIISGTSGMAAQAIDEALS